ncbi:AAA family ATPase [Yinghuangia aomiensis]
MPGSSAWRRRSPAPGASRWTTAASASATTPAARNRLTTRWPCSTRSSRAALVCGLPTVVDATNTDPTVRARLTDAARTHKMPAVAITVRKPLATCQARQKDRAANRQVPADVVAAQHAAVPTNEQLRAEGFAAVHDASDLDLLGMLLARSAAATPDPLAGVRATFGPDLAAVFAFDPDHDDSRGVFAVGGRQVVVRAWWESALPGVDYWQARCDGARCDRCGGTVWAVVYDADLVAVYRGELPDDLYCDRCDKAAPEPQR